MTDDTSTADEPALDDRKATILAPSSRSTSRRPSPSGSGHVAQRRRG